MRISRPSWSTNWCLSAAAACSARTAASAIAALVWTRWAAASTRRCRDEGVGQGEGAEDHVLHLQQVLGRRGRGEDPAGERHQEHEEVEQQVARLRRAHLPARHRRQRRAPAVGQAPADADHGQDEDHEAPALVGLGQGEAREQVRDELRHVEAEAELEQDQRRHRPVQGAGHPAPAGGAVAARALFRGHHQVDPHRQHRRDLRQAAGRAELGAVDAAGQVEPGLEAVGIVLGRCRSG